MKVYLGGPITGLTFDEARAWRLHAAALLEQHGITSLDPLRGKEELGRTDRPLSSWFDGGLEAVSRDLLDIRDSNILLLNFADCNVASIGTCAEMGYAFSSGLNEVVVVRNTDLYDHVFVDYMADKTFDNLEHALDYIISRPLVYPEGSGGVHGVELQNGAEGYRGWLTGSDQTSRPVADQPVRRAEVDGVRADKLDSSEPSWLREKFVPGSRRRGW